MTDDRHDDLDRRLRDYAVRWRAALPAPARTLPEPPRRRPARPVLVMAAAAVLVVASVGGTLALTRHESGHEAVPVDSSVVPWAALPATHPVLPVRTTAPDAVGTGSVPACRDDDLELGSPQADGAAGTTYLTFGVRLVGSRPCLLEGFPLVVPLSAGVPLDVTVEHGTDLGTAKPVLVRAGHPATVTIAWAVSHHCPVVTNDRLRVRLPGLTRDRVVEGFGTTSCNPGEAPSVMRVEPVHSPDAATTRTVSPYDDLVVSGDLDLTVDPGERVHFTVMMTSPADLSLAPCPDYRIVTAAGERTWALNCAEVPYRDAAGQPYLPAGTPVQFAMEADSGDRSTTKFLWILDGTRTPHDLSGTLAVRGDRLSGEIDGILLRVGGPAPGVSEKTPEGKVRVVGGTVDRTVSVGPDGSFTVPDLPAGDYRVTGSTPLWNDGAWGCQAAGPVQVRAGQASRADVICPMK